MGHASRSLPEGQSRPLENYKFAKTDMAIYLMAKRVTWRSNFALLLTRCPEHHLGDICYGQARIMAAVVSHVHLNSQADL